MPYQNIEMIVTGISRLDVYKQVGVGLRGRYFPYRMIPLSLSEVTDARIPDEEVLAPRGPPQEALDQLQTFGGFSEPFLKAETRFVNRWRRVRGEQLAHGEILDLTRIQEVSKLEILVHPLTAQTVQLVNYSGLAGRINTTADTIRRWIAALQSLYFCFAVRPWFRNVAKSLRKQPKPYLWDWSFSKEMSKSCHRNHLDDWRVCVS